MSTPLLELDKVQKHYKSNRSSFLGKPSYVKAVNSVSLRLFEGETLGLVGESGSGKSTTGQIIAQLISQTSGTVFYKGSDVTTFTNKQMKAWRKKVQIVFQDPYASLNPKKKIEWIVSEPLVIHRIGTKVERREKVVEVLEDVGLDASYLHRYPHELSGGQRQRVAIATAIILNPEFIVIDEGVSALDVSVQAQILNLLKQLQNKYKLTYLFISHDLNVIQYFCDRIAVMYLGEIVEQGRTDLIGSNLKHPYAQALFSANPTVDENKTQIVLGGEVPNSGTPPAGCPFHPRCAKAMETCSSFKPSDVHLNQTHVVRCHLYKTIEGNSKDTIEEAIR
ncbi:ABC transporter ATP-binding protein [Virgibacillus sp. MG-45]|uniref:ABC transporter ATP-binding protein n=1 Tax=Virgibacillus sp. MG-45 TaxID=3102791 RepID=UPI002EDAA2CE